MRNLLRIIAFIILIVIIPVGYRYFQKSDVQSTISVNKEDLLQAEINLGRKFFFDKRLSRDETISCSSCHSPRKAFTDGKAQSTGINGLFALRNAPSLYNLLDAPYFMHDGGVPTLEMQAIVPIQDLNEMGFSMKELIERLKTIPEYTKAAQEIYNREIDAWVITRSLTQFQKTLVSKNSRFDQFLEDSVKNPLTKSEMRGWQLFSQEINCVKCHSLPNLTNYSFESNGLTYALNKDFGRFRISGLLEDKGKFKVPSLRNITLTGPYMHDGSYPDLKSVLEAYLFSEKSMIITKKTYVAEDINSILDFFETLVDTNSVDLSGFLD